MKETYRTSLYEGIEVQHIPQSEFHRLILTDAIVGTATRRSESVFTLRSGKVLKENVGMEYYLFQSSFDYEAFLSSIESASNSNTLTETELHIAALLSKPAFKKETLEIKRIFSEANNLENKWESLARFESLDILLQHFTYSDIVNNMTAICLLCADGIALNSSESEWKVLPSGKPVFVADGVLHSPCDYVETESKKVLERKNYHLSTSRLIRRA